MTALNAGLLTPNDLLELVSAKRVLWEVLDGPEEWIGTTVSWDLKQDGDYTVVLFKHRGWNKPVEFMHHCSTKRGLLVKPQVAS
jgi:hypothetical protein